MGCAQGALSQRNNAIRKTANGEGREITGSPSTIEIHGGAGSSPKSMKSSARRVQFESPRNGRKMGPGPLLVRSEEAYPSANIYIRAPCSTPVGRPYPHAQYQNGTHTERWHLLHYQQEGDEQCLRPFCSGHEDCHWLQS